MKKRYLKPTLELYSYNPEKGYATSVALERNTRDRDYVLIEGDRHSMRATEEVTEYTDEGGQFMTGEWD